LHATANATAACAVFGKARHCRLDVRHTLLDFCLLSIALNSYKIQLPCLGHGALYLDASEVKHSTYNGICVTCMR
jgi:hypothetical protein